MAQGMAKWHGVYTLSLPACARWVRLPQESCRISMLVAAATGCPWLLFLVVEIKLGRSCSFALQLAQGLLYASPFALQTGLI